METRKEFQDQRAFYVKVWIPAEHDDCELMTLDEALREFHHLRALQPENIYKVEMVEEVIPDD